MFICTRAYATFLAIKRCAVYCIQTFDDTYIKLFVDFGVVSHLVLIHLGVSRDNQVYGSPWTLSGGRLCALTENGRRRGPTPILLLLLLELLLNSTLKTHK